MLDWERSGIFERIVGFVPIMVTITAPGEAPAVILRFDLWQRR
jgi:hypothetical protein